MADLQMLQHDNLVADPVPRRAPPAAGKQPQKPGSNKKPSNRGSNNSNNNRRAHINQAPFAFNSTAIQGILTPSGFIPQAVPYVTPTAAPVVAPAAPPVDPPIVPSSDPKPQADEVNQRLSLLAEQMLALQEMTNQILANNVTTPKLENPPPPLNPKKFLQHVLQCLKDYTPRVPRSLVETYMRVIGGKPEPINDSILGENPHALEAALRNNTNHYAVFELIKINPEKFLLNPTITFVYGTETRDRAVIDYYNNALTRLFNYPVDFIKVKFFGNTITPDDLRRRKTVDTEFSDFALFMDVYMLATDKITPLTIQKLGFNHWIWCGHPFPNMYGGILNAYYVRFINEAGQSCVYFKPDGVNNPYPPHDPCDIFHQSGSMSDDNINFVTWSIVHPVYITVYHDEQRKQILAYNIVRGETTDQKFLEPPSVINQSSKIVKLPSFDFTNGMPWWAHLVSFKTLVNLGLCQESYVYVDSALRQFAQRQLITKYFNQWSWTSCLKAVSDYLDADLFYSRCELLLPDLFKDYRLKVAAALYTESCNAKANTTASMVAIHGDTMYEANKALGAIGKVREQVTFPRVLAVGAAAAALGFLYYKGHKPKLCDVVSSVQKQDSPPLDYDPNSLVYRASFAFGKYFVAPLIHYTPITLDHVLKTLDVVVDVVNTSFKMFIPCVFSPIVEENIKSLFGSYKIIPSAVIGYLDLFQYTNHFVGYDSASQNTIFAILFLYHTTVHYLMASLPLKWAIVTHSALNAVQGHRAGLFCSAYGLCETAQQIGRPCRTISSSLALGPVLAWAGTNQMIRSYDVPIFTLPEFDLAVDSNYYFDGHHNFIMKYDGSQAFRPATRCVNKIVRRFDPSVTYDADILQKFKLEMRTPEGQNLGYFRYWAHQVPMFRPDTSGWNTAQMVTNRLIKAPPSILDLSDDDYWKRDEAKCMSVYKQFSSYYPALLAYFNDPQDRVPLCMDAEPENTFWRKQMIHLLQHKYNCTTIPEVFKMYAAERPGISYWHSEEGYLEYEDHLPGSKRRLMREMKAKDELNPIDIHSPETNQTTYSSKTDEVLFKPDCSPRPIGREAPQFSMHVGRSIYFASKHIQSFFTKRLIKLCQDRCCINPNKLHRVDHFYMVYMSDLSGYTDLKLSEWFHSVYTVPGWHIGASGDDSLCIYNNGSYLQIFEGDVSQCDHSVRIATLLYEWFILFSFGVDSEILDLLRVNARSKLMVENKTLGLKLHIERSYERHTGSPDTTIGNTLIVSSLWLFFIQNFLSNSADFSDPTLVKDTQKWFLNTFGFSMKINYWRTKVDCSFQSPTILKGWFLHTPNHEYPFTWSPLPSRLLKLCKVLTPPNVILKRTKIPKAPYGTVTLDQAWVLLVSMHKGMASYVNLPYVNKWRAATFYRYALYSAQRAYMPPISDIALYNETFQEHHRPQACTNGDKVCKCWRYMFCDRYHVQLADLIDFSNRIVDITPFTFFVHPVWNQLALVDYLG